MWDKKISLVDYFNNVYWGQISGLDAGNGLSVGQQFDKGIISGMYASGDSNVGSGGWGPMHQGLVSSYNTYSSTFDKKQKAAAEYAQNLEDQAAQAADAQAKQLLKIGSIQAAGNALNSSLQILAKNNSGQAPTATMTKKKKKSAAPASSSASLKIGSTASASGAGSNLAV